ncbi:YihY family inner membrane protein [Roseovarius salinarum]|uniref:YihY family inner membrane protein n=1 Tax=Roseovarius salinarum TaxID=1981892 RepID=UPI0012FFD634|nr:YihY family inner membrane protein [Roseovarius salinarum]
MTLRRMPTDTLRQAALRARAADLAGFVRYAVRRFHTDGMTQAAGALTYSTLLALVPLLVIAFAILSGFSAFRAARARMEEMFFDMLVPEAGAQVADYLSDFTANANDLTAVGIVALAVTALLLLSTIETTLNRIWRVERPRPIMIRLLNFWAILTLGPLLLATSFSFSGDLLDSARDWVGAGEAGRDLRADWPVLDTLVAIAGQSATFTLLFKLVPARSVRLSHAALGGVVSGVGVQILRWGFNVYLTSSTTYETIYGAVAVIPVFLLWIYLSWTVIIFGAVFAAAFPDWWKTRGAQPDAALSPAGRLEVAVALLGALHRCGGVATQARLEELVPLDARNDILEALQTNGYAVTTEEGAIGLTRDLHATPVVTLARDLGLALGAAEGGDAAPPHKAAGALPGLLRDLHAAEDRVLATPLADVLAGRTPD